MSKLANHSQEQAILDCLSSTESLDNLELPGKQ